jgi:hypothetical protein
MHVKDAVNIARVRLVTEQMRDENQRLALTLVGAPLLTSVAVGAFLYGWGIFNLMPAPQVSSVAGEYYTPTDDHGLTLFLRGRVK